MNDELRYAINDAIKMFILFFMNNKKGLKLEIWENMEVNDV